MRARLLEGGISLEQVGTREASWDDAVAWVESESPWGAIHRALDPESWVWYIPGFSILVTIAENQVLASYANSDEKPPKDVRVPRPWDKKASTKKLPGVAVNFEEFSKEFESYFT